METTQTMTSDSYKYIYDEKYWKTYDQGDHMEWVITNGLGGYGGGSLIGGRNRTHQGYLIASLHPPVQRFAVLDQVTEWVKIGKAAYDLETSRHRIDGKTEYLQGQKYLKQVEYDGTVTFRYEIRGCDTCEKIPPDKKTEDNTILSESLPAFKIKKNIGLLRDENTAAIAYEFVNNSNEEAIVVLTPFFNFRDHNELTKKEDLEFEMLITGDTLSLVPHKNSNVRIDFSISEGDYYELMDKYNVDQELITEIELETEGLCTSYTPYEISISVPAHEIKKVSVLCSTVYEKDDEPGFDKTGLMQDESIGEDDTLEGISHGELDLEEDGPFDLPSSEDLLDKAVDRFVGPSSAEKLLGRVKEYYSGLVEKSGYKDIFASRLVIDADHFFAKRESTGLETILAGLPWFTDWGRDTMISFTGLTLCTKRFDDARQILKSFAIYLHNGMIPNMFPDDGARPLYNTVDASLWYFYAVHKYMEYAGGDSEFIKTEIYPVLVNILDHYEKGTDFSIYMERNGLLHAGSDLDQITWMDVRVGDMVVTPRHGCPVEINALWYNALKIGQELAETFDDDKNRGLAGHYSELAGQIKASFEELYWNKDRNCLYDVVYRDIYSSEGESWKADASLRPNQIYAVSLPYPLLDPDKERAVVDTVEKELYTGTGLRSLSKDHPDYHGQYRGALSKRDLAYHQGTSWGFLTGAFITAYAKVHKGEPDIESKLDKLFEPVRFHQSEENCVGGICEIFEGDEPHSGRGCYTQAWSTGEVLRAYIEDLCR